MSQSFASVLSGLRPGLRIPEHALRWSFTPTGGPGGQHANRSATQASLRVDLADVEAPDAVLEALRGEFGPTLGFTSSDSRSQMANRVHCLERLVAAVNAAAVPARPRRATRPSPGAKRRTRADKTHTSAVKALRRRPDRDRD